MNGTLRQTREQFTLLASAPFEVAWPLFGAVQNFRLKRAAIREPVRKLGAGPAIKAPPTLATDRVELSCNFYKPIQQQAATPRPYSMHQRLSY